MPKSICIARPALPRLRSFNHRADALGIERLTSLVAVAGIFQLVDCFPGGQSALAVRVRAAGTAHPPGRQLYRAGRWRDCKARARLAAHLRHSCGYYLADQGTDLRTMQDYLGHRDPKHTAHYTRVAGHRFEGLWK
jgi:integrase-like protein